MKTNKFDGKVIVITGAANGIGRSAAERFASQGAKVVVSDIDVDHGRGVVADIEKAGGEAKFISCDVTDEAEVHGLIRRTVEAFGRLDYAFNNAGWEGVMQPLDQLDSAVFDKVIGINLRGVFLCMKYELKQMIEQGDGGSIVNNSSIAGLKGFPFSSEYCASKHGIVGMTKSAALEYAKQGIRINALCPGVIETEMISRAANNDPETMAGYAAMEPVGRMGRPEEVAALAEWLCSDEASFVTGAAVAVDGGVMAG